MNKKNLSVVMAGAMLATSVAPVLAAETTTVNGSNKGLMIKEFRELLESKTFANEKVNNSSTTSALKDDYAGKSVYYIKETTHKDEVINVNTLGVSGNALKTLNEEIDTLETKLGISLSNVAPGTEAGKIKLEAEKDTVISNDRYYEVSVKASAIAASGSANITVKAKKIDTVSEMEAAIQNAKDGMKFEAWDKGHREENGKYYAFDYATYNDGTGTDSLTSVYNTWEANPSAYPAVLKMELENKDTLVVTSRIADTETTTKVHTFKTGDKIVDFTKAHTVDHKEIAIDTEFGTINDKSFDHYAEDANKVVDIEESRVKSIVIDEADQVYNVALSDLYDGLFLTEKGQEFIDAMKEYDTDVKWTITDLNTNNKESDGTLKVNSIYNPEFEIDTDDNGLYRLEIEFSRPVPGTNNKENKFVNRVVITSDNRERMELFADGIKRQPYTEGATRKFPVQVLAGDNRYETAVKVAKENADIKTVAENGNIVLVNGNSLVDGLAAAPLAASVINDGNNGTPRENISAPILLTDANGIPKATKDYMKEIIGQQQVMNLDKVTVYLVGGTSVISKAVENDLKEIGLRVVRAGGADREATSLAVAELMAKDTAATTGSDAFLVGANGEADAMSIAPVAAATGTPIIVESVHGISDDTINYLQGYKNDTNGVDGKDVTIIGGETAVSASTENLLKDEKLNVQRLFGANRKETNAKVIDAYYNEKGNVNGVTVNPGHSLRNVVVSKDGMKNKSELIDALTATSLAVRDNAPIVLATDKLSDGQNGQINALNKNASRDGVYVYQVGIGVARDVIQTIADRVGLAK